MCYCGSRFCGRCTDTICTEYKNNRIKEILGKEKELITFGAVLNCVAHGNSQEKRQQAMKHQGRHWDANCQKKRKPQKVMRLRGGNDKPNILQCFGFERKPRENR